MLQSQELDAKKTAWASTQVDSIQTRDRHAAYAVSHITARIYEVEAAIKALNIERSLVERLLDAS